MFEVKAVKNWFLEKQGFIPEVIEELQKRITFETLKETEKAVFVKYRYDGFGNENDKRYENEGEIWIPKSVCIDRWEKVVSPFVYHDYLVDLVRDNGCMGNKPIDSGYKLYRADAFVHQYKTKELQQILEKCNVKYMSFTEWKNR